jgi:hypothetical protein
MRLNIDSEYGMALVRKGKALTVRGNVFHRKRSTDFSSNKALMLALRTCETNKANTMSEAN